MANLGSTEKEPMEAQEERGEPRPRVRMAVRAKPARPGLRVQAQRPTPPLTLVPPRMVDLD